MSFTTFKIIQNYITGFSLDNKTGNPLTTLNIGQGFCSDSSNSAYIEGLAMSKTTSLWQAGNGNGMLDQGTLSPGGSYHIFAISNYNGTLSDYIMSANSIAPLLPPAFQIYRRVRSFILQSASTNIQAFTQYGNTILYPQPIQNVDAVGAAASLQAMTCSTPAGISVRCSVMYNVQNTATTGGAGLIYIHETSGTDIVPDPIADCGTTKDSNGNNQENAGRVWIYTDNASTIYWRPNALISTLQVQLFTVGFEYYLLPFGV